MKISIITINYNNREGLERTIKSVIGQKDYEFEFIVIDGNSSDGSKDVIKKYAESLSYWVSEPDSGIYNAMNKGIAASHGEYLLFLNSGDCLHTNGILAEVDKELDGTDLIIGQVWVVPSNRIGWDDVVAPITMFDFYKGGPIPHQATFIKRNLFDKHKYDESYKIVSDWKFFIQVMIFEECSYKIIKLIISDFEEDGISSRKYLCDPEREKVIQEFLPANIRLDYLKFLNGAGYEETNYDKLFLKIKGTRSGQLAYFLIVSLMKILSLFVSSVKFTRKLPFKYNN